MNIFIAPFVNALFGFYYLLGNLGWAIVLVTIVIRIILLPLMLPSLKSAKKMKDLQPKLNRLKDKYGSDKQGLAKAQMDLYKQEGVNPLSGCLPQILQIAVLILFFQAFNMVTNFSTGNGNFQDINNQLIQSFQIPADFKFDLNFMGSDLAMTPSKAFQSGIGLALVLPLILLVGSGILQYFSAKMMMPSTKTDENVAKVTPAKEDDMMAAMRTQSLYFMPLMTIFIGWGFNLGILLYWFVNSVVIIVQQILTDRLSKT